MGDDITPPQYPPTTPRHSAASDPADTSTTDVAKDQAGQVADTAKQAGAQVAGTVKEQAGQVTAEAGNQAKQLLAQAQSEVTEQAAATQQRVADGLHALADELTGMARNSDQDGPATDLARQAAEKAHQAAGWLADRDPGSLLNEVRSFARRKPGTYLALALGAGVLAGRLTRGLTAPAADNTQAPTTTAHPATPQYQVGAGQHSLTGGLPIGAPRGYDPVPVADPILAVPPPITGNGGTGKHGGPRDVVAP
jgi:uncharacterized protein YjbJ (UPF0337 family)